MQLERLLPRFDAVCDGRIGCHRAVGRRFRHRRAPAVGCLGSCRAQHDSHRQAAARRPVRRPVGPALARRPSRGVALGAWREAISAWHIALFAGPSFTTRVRRRRSFSSRRAAIPAYRLQCRGPSQRVSRDSLLAHGVKNDLPARAGRILRGVCPGHRRGRQNTNRLGNAGIRENSCEAGRRSAFLARHCRSVLLVVGDGHPDRGHGTA